MNAQPANRGHPAEWIQPIAIGLDVDAILLPQGAGSD
jgi:hypothetical protein